MRKKIFIIIFILSVFSGILPVTQAYSTLSKEDVSREDIESADKAILLFWTTWCPYCRTAVKEFSQMCEDLQGQGFQLYMVNMGEKPIVVRKFLQDKGVKCQVVLDEETVFGSQYRILGIPTYIFIQEGKVLGRTGYINKEILEKIYE